MIWIVLAKQWPSVTDEEDQLLYFKLNFTNSGVLAIFKMIDLFSTNVWAMLSLLLPTLLWSEMPPSAFTLAMQNGQSGEEHTHKSCGINLARTKRWYR